MLKGNPPRFRNGKCSNCGWAERMNGQRYCHACHAAKERERRLIRKTYTQILPPLNSA